MNNKTTLLDIFNNIQKPINNKFNDNKNAIKNIPFIQKYIVPYLKHKNILIGILFFVLVWLIVKWFMEHVYVNVSDDFKNKQKLRKERFLNFIKSIFSFVYKSLTPFTLLIFLYISYMFKDNVTYVFKIILDLFAFILSMIKTNHIIKFVISAIILIIICFIGKLLLKNINIIENGRDRINILINNQRNVKTDIDNMQNKIKDNDFDIKEYSRFIKSNLLDWNNIKQDCNHNKLKANVKLGDVAIAIPTKFNNNVNIYNIRNQTANQMRDIREQKLKEREILLQKRKERLQKLQTEIVYAQMDADEKTRKENIILRQQQQLLNQERQIRNNLANLKHETLMARVHRGDPSAYASMAQGISTGIA